METVVLAPVRLIGDALPSNWTTAPTRQDVNLHLTLQSMTLDQQSKTRQGDDSHFGKRGPLYSAIFNVLHQFRDTSLRFNLMCLVEAAKSRGRRDGANSKNKITAK